MKKNQIRLNKNDADAGCPPQVGNPEALNGVQPDRRTVRAWARLVRVSQNVLAAVEMDLREAGFPPLVHYDALLELDRADPAGLRPFELQAEMLLAQYSISRLTDRLAKAGHVRRQAAEGDGRGQVLRITPEGKDVLHHMWPVYAAAIQNHFGRHLDKDATDALLSALGRLSDAGDQGR